MIKKYNSKVLDIKKTGENIREVFIEKPENTKFNPGQYISIQIDEKTKIRKPYSIASINSDADLEICAKNLRGSGSRYIFSLKKGDVINYIFPMGDFTIKNSKRNLIFIAVGTGIAPFKSMILELLENQFKKKIILVRGARNENELVYHKIFSDLEKKYPNFKYYNAISRPKSKKINNGYVQDFLTEIIPKSFKGDFYICGMAEMIKAVSEKLQDLKFKRENIFFEEYD